MRKPAYFERNGCIYVAFNTTSLDAGLPPCETEPPETLLTDFMRDWLQIMASQIRHNTLDSYWHMFNRHIEPFFGVRQITVQSASLSDFQEFVDKNIKMGIPQPQLQNFILLFINACAMLFPAALLIIIHRIMSCCPKKSNISAEPSIRRS